MAQKQHVNPPMAEISDMWHLGDANQGRERQLPRNGLEISWISQRTNQNGNDEKVLCRYYK